MKTVKVVAAVICDGAKVFATARGYGDYKGLWEFPGGKIEPGETPQQALKREIMEELAAEIEVGALIGTIEYDYPAFHLSMGCYLARIISGEPVLREAEAACWLSAETLGSVAWLPADLTIIPQIRDELEYRAERQRLLEEGLKDHQMRRAYEDRVRRLTDLRNQLYADGLSEEEIARYLHEQRRQLGREYKEAAPELVRRYIYYATAQRYGDPLGPDYDQLRQRKSPAQIIESSARPIDDLDNRLTIDGFDRWYHEVYKTGKM